MQVTELTWSVDEIKITNLAFKAAYEREITALVQEVQRQANGITVIDDMWRLHDFLSGRRHDVEGKYDPSQSGLLFTLAKLVKEKWITVAELEGLDKSKVAKISALSRM